jgi:hypothetical protein
MAAIDQHANGVLVEVDALVDRLLVTVVPDAVLRTLARVGVNAVSTGHSYLAALDANIRNGKRGAAPQPHAGVTSAVGRIGHADFDVLEMGDLGNTPVKRSEWLVSGHILGIENDVLEADGKRKFAGDSRCRVLAGKQGAVAREARRGFDDRRLLGSSQQAMKYLQILQVDRENPHR